MRTLSHAETIKELDTLVDRVRVIVERNTKKTPRKPRVIAAAAGAIRRAS